MNLTFDPDEMAFEGLGAPVRAEAAIQSLEVTGKLPAELAGEYYRVGPDPAFPPFHKGFAPIVDGDGMMVAFAFRDGHVDFRSRYVETERLQLQRAANRALFGSYRNPYSDDPSVAGRDRGTANTTMRMHAGVLYALKEDSPGISVQRNTLQTLGSHDFGGRFTSCTMTAHPKIDPISGEMIFYGSAAKGETTPDIAYYMADETGTIKVEKWFEAPYASMVHDFCVTENWVVFPVMPTTSNLERIKAGGPAYDWEPQRGMYLGVMSRNAADPAVRWFHHDTRWFYHCMNAFEEDGRLQLDVTESGCQPFPWLHVDPGRTWNRELAKPVLTRWTLDPAKGTLSVKPLTDLASEMPRVDERYELGTYRHGWMLVDDPAHPPAGIGQMNSLAHIDHLTGALTSAWAGPNSQFEEPQFVPRSADSAEGDGFILALRHHGDTMLSDLLIFDTDELDGDPVALVKLPFRVRPGTHGTWVAS